MRGRLKRESVTQYERYFSYHGSVVSCPNETVLGRYESGQFEGYMGLGDQLLKVR